MRWTCQEIADQQNKILRSRGLKWNLPENFPDWIELTKDMEKPMNGLRSISQQHIIPPITRDTIVFPAWNSKIPENFMFSHEFYSPEMTDDRISREEIQDFISEVNADQRKTSKNHDSGRSKEEGVLRIYLFLCLMFLPQYIDRYFDHFVAEIMIVTNISAVTILIFYMVLSDNRHNKEKNIKIRAGCQKIVDKYNETLSIRGLRWHLPEKFPLWIELCKDYKDQSRDYQSTHRFESETTVQRQKL